MFHTTSNVNDSLGFLATSDWKCAYNLTASSRILGKDADGVSFRRASNSANDTCSSDTSSSTVIHPGAAVLSLSSIGRENIQVSWTGKIFTSFTYATSGTVQTRFYVIKLQYRTDTLAAFADVPGANIFYSNSDSVTYKPSGTSEVMPTVTLPYFCGNQPILQLRWLYYQSKIGGGQRAELGVDEINVASDIFTSVKSVNTNSALRAFPNPNAEHVFNFTRNVSGEVYSAIGANVATISNSSKLNLVNVPNGVYFLRTNKGEILKLILQ
jgi:hypothetical protein